MAWLALIGLGSVVGIAAVIRFVNHLRLFKKWWPDRPTSCKKRLERDL